MTTNTNKTHEDQLINDLDKELQEKIEQEKAAEEVHEEDSIDNKFSLLDEENKKKLIQEVLGENEKLKSDLDKMTRAGAMFKTELDSVMRKLEIERKESKYIELKKIVVKFHKLLEGIRMFLSHLDRDLAESEQIKGLQILYESFLSQELASMGVMQIVSLGYSPDPELHEVFMIQEATQADMDYLKDNNIKLDGDRVDYAIGDIHGKIIREFEVGYYYFDGEKKIVIKPSKVVVAS